MKNKKRTSLETLKKFFSLILLRKLRYSKYFFRTFLWGINGVIHILFLEKIVFNLENLNSEGFYKILIYYGIYIFTFEICNYLMRNWSRFRVESKQKYDIYNEYLHKYIRLDNNIVETIGTGKLIGIIYNGTILWSELLSESIEKLMMIFVSFLFTIYMISRVDINYALIFIILCITFFFLGKEVNIRLNKYRKQRYEVGNILLRNFTKIIMSKVDILQSGKIDTDMQKMYLNLEHEEKINDNMSIGRNFLKRIAPFGITLMMFFAFWYLGNGVMNGSVKLSVLVGLTGALIIIQKSIIDAMNFYIVFTRKIINVEKIFEFFDTTPEIKGYEIGNEFKYKAGDIEIKDLSYYYTKGKLVFKNFNLKIEGEKVLALVGNSGSGKSTLAKLISGYIHPIKGNVIVDGQKLNKTSLKSYYREIGYLTQEPSVFDGTIIDNLTYAIDRDLIEGELDNIIKLSKCEFIYDLPKGLDTEIGERGVRLSGGQKQRLAIAKIFLKNPKIIILDEPTSALDSFSEEQITKAMHNLFKNRTVIVIAHRLQTVKYADKIIVLEDGKVVETGNHKELVKQRGIYKKMLDLQSGF